MPLDTYEFKYQLERSRPITTQNVAEQATATSKAAATGLGNIFRIVKGYQGQFEIFLREIGVKEPTHNDAATIDHAFSRYAGVTSSHELLNFSQNGFFGMEEVIKALRHSSAEAWLRSVSPEGWVDKPNVGTALTLDRLAGQVDCRDAVLLVLKPTIDTETAARLRQFVQDGQNEAEIVAVAKAAYADAPLPSKDVLEGYKLYELNEPGMGQLYVEMVLENVRVQPKAKAS